MQITNISNQQVNISYYDNNEVLCTISLIPGCSVSTTSSQMTKPLIIYQRKGIILIENNKVINISKESIVIDIKEEDNSVFEFNESTLEPNIVDIKDEMSKKWKESGVLDGLKPRDMSSEKAIKLDELLRSNDKQIIIHDLPEEKKEDVATIEDKEVESDSVNDIKEIIKIEKKKDKSKSRDSSEAEKGKFSKKSSEPILNSDLPF